MNIRNSHPFQIIRLLQEESRWNSFVESVSNARNDEAAKEFETSYAELNSLQKMYCDCGGAFKALIERFIDECCKEITKPISVTTAEMVQAVFTQLLGVEMVDALHGSCRFHFLRAGFLLHNDVNVADSLTESAEHALEFADISFGIIAADSSIFVESLWAPPANALIGKLDFDDYKYKDWFPNYKLSQGDKDVVIAEWLTRDRLLCNEKGWRFPLWTNNEHVSIYLLPSYTNDIDLDEAATCHFVLDGPFTEEARKQAIEWSRQFVESTTTFLKCAALDVERRPAVIQKHCELWKILGEADDSLDTPGWVSLAYFYSAVGRRLFRTSFELQISESTLCQEDVRYSILNALKLLQLESQLKESGLALALSFAAAEAILCEQEHGPTASLKNFGSTLLQPDNAKRKLAAQRIGRLYELRNDVMHGRNLNVGTDKRLLAKRFAAGVVRNAINYLDHCQKMGENIAKRDFLTELTICQRKGQEMIGVENLEDLLPKPTIH